VCDFEVVNSPALEEETAVDPLEAVEFPVG
jgi:hypothetical protein